MDLTAKVLRSLGLPDTPLPPMVVTSIEAHRRLLIPRVAARRGRLIECVVLGQAVKLPDMVLIVSGR